jgi:hypothetical protein
LAFQSLWYFEEKNIRVLYEIEFGLDNRENYIVKPVVELSAATKLAELSAATKLATPLGTTFTK